MNCGPADRYACMLCIKTCVARECVLARVCMCVYLQGGEADGAALLDGVGPEQVAEGAFLWRLVEPIDFIDVLQLQANETQ